MNAPSPLPAANPRMRPWITDDDKAAVMAVLDSGDLMGGKQVAAFEEELAAYFGKRHAVCVSSGTAALECAFAATGEGGLIHPHGFIAILTAARAAGHNPKPDEDKGVATDVLGVSYSVNTRVHDCSHSFEAHGDLSCFSFNQNKIIACVGGVVVTDDGVAAAFMRQYRNHGREGSRVYQHGRHLRMGEVNAALGMSQLRRVGEIIKRREMVSGGYPKYNGGRWRFLYPWGERPALAKKHRSLADFRLFDTATQEDRETALLPIWPLMTKDDCEAVCAS